MITLKRQWKKKPTRFVQENLSHPLNKGLAHSWRMMGRGSQVNDSISRANGVFLSGNPPQNTIDGEEGIVLTTPASDNGQVNINGAPTYSATASGAFTCEFRFRRHSGTGYGSICVKSDGNYGFWTTGGNLIFYAAANGDSAATAITNNVWHHVVATFTPNGSNMDLQIYLDGVAGGSRTNMLCSFIPQRFFAHAAEYFIGDISFFKIYKGLKTTAEITALYKNTWQTLQPITQYIPTSVVGATAGLTGTMTASVVEGDIVAGGKTIIITLTNDTFVAAGTGPIGSTADTQALIDGFDAASSPTNGWNNEVRDKALTSEIVRTSSTVATWTVSAQAGYDVSAQETITGTIPAAVLTGAVEVVATPTFTVDFTGGATLHQTTNYQGMSRMNGAMRS